MTGPTFIPATRDDLLRMIAGTVDSPNSFLDVAAEILWRIEQAGLVIVPAEETEAMLDAAITAEAEGDDTWAAKLLASPFLSE